MKKKQKKYITTTVTPTILRQINEYRKLKNITDLSMVTFVDYFAISVNQIREEYIATKCRLVKQTRNNAFNTVATYESTDGFRFTIYTDNIFNSDWDFQVHINPAYFVSQDEFKAAVENICYPLYRNNHQVSRIDISISINDTLLTPALIHFCGYFKWKRKNTTYSQSNFNQGALTGTAIRSKTVSYSSYSETAKKRKKEKIAKEDIVENHCNFEIQLKKTSLHKHQILSVFDIHRVPATPLMYRMEFYDIVRIKKSNIHFLDKFKDLQMECLASGFNQARKRLNPKKNFMRDYQNYLECIYVENNEKLSSLINRKMAEMIVSWSPWKELPNQELSLAQSQIKELPLQKKRFAMPEYYSDEETQLIQ